MHSSPTVGQLAIVAICVTVMTAAPAASQGTAARRPAGGLFGATRADHGGPGKLNFTFELAESVDGALPPEIGVRVARGLQDGGLSTWLAASSDYARNGRRLQLAANASTAFRYYRRHDRIDALSHSAGLGASLRLPKQGNLRVESTAAYSPSYLFQLFPSAESPALGASIPAQPDYQINGTDSYTYRTAIAVAFGSQRGTQVTTSGAFARTDFQDQTAARRDLEIYETGARISHSLSRTGRLSVEYRHRSGEFGYGGLTNEHRVTIGTEYSPALSPTRRAIVRFNLSPATLSIPEAAVAAIAAGETNGRLNRMLAEASVSYPFRPNWRTTGSVRRSVEYLAVLGQPVLADGARAEVVGLISRRADLSVSAGYASAASILSRNRETLDTYTGEARIRYALKRSVALYSEYLYYYYDLRGQTGLAPDLPNVFTQHSVRAGLTLFIDALGR